jgi:hypothetical protein
MNQRIICDGLLPGVVLAAPPPTTLLLQLLLLLTVHDPCDHQQQA